MDLLKRTDSKLVFGLDWSSWLSKQSIAMIILATFLVPPAGALVRALWEVGTVTLTCRRVEPLQVQCQESRTHLFGLQTSTSLTMDWVSGSP